LLICVYRYIHTVDCSLVVFVVRSDYYVLYDCLFDLEVPEGRCVGLAVARFVLPEDHRGERCLLATGNSTNSNIARLRDGAPQQKQLQVPSDGSTGNATDSRRSPSLKDWRLREILFSVVSIISLICVVQNFLRENCDVAMSASSLGRDELPKRKNSFQRHQYFRCDLHGQSIVFSQSHTFTSHSQCFIP
jgi:hypothetical protein